MRTLAEQLEQGSGKRISGGLSTAAASKVSLRAVAAAVGRDLPAFARSRTTGAGWARSGKTPLCAMSMPATLERVLATGKTPLVPFVARR